MDETDIEILNAVFTAFAKRDVAGVLMHAADDIVFTPMTADYAGRDEAYVGHDGIRDYFRDVSSVWDHITVTPTKFRQVGDTVLVTGKISAVAPGRLVAGSTGWIWRLRAGKIVYGRVYPSAGAATAALENGGA
jgi:ketosteroid isomerase-like protein